MVGNLSCCVSNVPAVCYAIVFGPKHVLLVAQDFTLGVHASLFTAVHGSAIVRAQATRTEYLYSMPCEECRVQVRVREIVCLQLV